MWLENYLLPPFPSSDSTLNQMTSKQCREVVDQKTHRELHDQRCMILQVRTQTKKRRTHINF